MRKELLALTIAGAIVTVVLISYAYSYLDNDRYSSRLTISSTTDMAALDGVVGSGTVADPYILQDMNFIADQQSPMISISDRDDYIILRNILIEGDNDFDFSDELSLHNYENCIGIYLKNARNCTISHCSFKSMFTAVEAINCQNLSVTDCSFYECRGANKISIDDESTPFPRTRNIMIQTNTYAFCAYAIVANNFDNLTIEENLFLSCQRGIVAYTIWLNSQIRNSGGLNVFLNTVEYLQSDIRPEGFISVSSCNEVTIASNDATSTLDCFADIDQSNRVSIRDNIITSRCMGIFAGDCQYIEIRNNSIKMQYDAVEMAYTGVRIIDCSNLTLTGNEICSWIWTSSVSVELVATFAGATTGVASNNILCLLVETEGVEVVWG